MAKKLTKKQQYLEAVWKLQRQCNKQSIPWGEFKDKLGGLNGNPTAKETTPPPGSTPPPPPQ